MSELTNVTERQYLDHEADSCLDPECERCGARDCPAGEPLHYHHDGCPVCDTEYRRSHPDDVSL